MSRRNDDYEYIYRTEANAALKPELAPRHTERERRREQEEKRRAAAQRARQAQKHRASQRLAATAAVTLSVLIGALGFLIVSRHAQIYENNRTIRQMSAQIAASQMKLNAVEKDMAEKADLNTYFAVAEEEGLTYPTQQQKVTVRALAIEGEETQEEQGNLYDTILDWWNSLGRRN